MSHVGEFHRYHFAWSAPLPPGQPAWIYIVEDEDGDLTGIQLMGELRIQAPFGRFAELNFGGTKDPRYARYRVVPLDKVPDDVLAALAEWRLTQ